MCAILDGGRRHETVKNRTYDLRVEAPPDVTQALGRYKIARSYERLGEARRKSRAIEELFPDAKTRIVSAQTRGARIVTMLKG